MIVRKITLFIMLLIVGCADDKSKCIITNESILAFNKKKLVLVKEKNGLVNDLVDKGRDSATEVGYYTFYNNGNLKSYRFFVTEKAYVYSEEYDQFGVLQEQKGTPIVYKKTKVSLGDSACFTYYFSTLKREFDSKVEVRVNETPSFYSYLQKDELRSNMNNLFFKVKPKDTVLNVVIRATYKDNCSKKINQLNDTFVVRLNENR